MKKSSWMYWRCVYEKIRKEIYILNFAALHVYEFLGIVELSSNVSILYMLALYWPIIRKHTPPSRHPLSVLFLFPSKEKAKNTLFHMPRALL